MRRSIRKKFLISAFFAAALPALLAITLLYYLLSLHDAMVMGHLREISKKKESIIKSYKTLITGKKRRFSAQTRLMGIQLAEKSTDTARFNTLARELFSKHPELAKIALYPHGTFEDLETSTLLETPSEKPAYLKERRELFSETSRYVSHVRRAGPYELQVVMATTSTDLNNFKTLGTIYEGNNKVIRIFKGIRKYYWYLFFIILVVIVLLSSTLSNMILKRVARKIKQMSLATQEVAGGNLETTVPVEGNDELASLAKDFNGMVQELRETRSRIRYLERMGAWQEVARNLAHEIKNPLTPILLAVEQIQEKTPRDNPRFVKLVETASGLVKEEVATLRRLVDTFGNLARLPEKKVEPIEMKSYLEEIAALARLTWATGTITLVNSIPPEVEVLGDRMLLKRALLNIIENAVHAMEPLDQWELTIIGEVGKRWVKISVKDKGTGFENTDRIFDPYFTTKDKGTGLGLPLARKIILDICGDLKAHNRKSGGASMVALLPLREENTTMAAALEKNL